MGDGKDSFRQQSLHSHRWIRVSDIRLDDEDLNRFTNAAWAAIHWAKAYAAERDSDVVTSVDLLLGVMTCCRPRTYRAITRFGIKFDDVRLIARKFGAWGSTFDGEPSRDSRGMLDALVYSVWYANQIGMKTVSIEMLFLGILFARRSVASGLIRKLAIDLEIVQARIHAIAIGPQPVHLIRAAVARLPASIAEPIYRGYRETCDFYPAYPSLPLLRRREMAAKVPGTRKGKSLTAQKRPASPFDHFDNSARSALAAAQDAAIERNQSELSTVHLLLGILSTGQTATIQILTAHGLSNEHVQASLEASGTQRSQEAIGGIALTTGFKTTLEGAVQAAAKLQIARISEAMLLIGMLDGASSTGKQLLLEGNLSESSLREWLITTAVAANDQSSRRSSSNHVFSSVWPRNDKH